MEDSILKSTKKILGLPPEYTAFDIDVITHINSVFGILSQMGVGPAAGFMIEDETTNWEEFIVPQNQLNMVKTYMFLKVSMLFDPPTTSFLIEAKNDQIAEWEWRLREFREMDIPLVIPIPEDELI